MIRIAKALAVPAWAGYYNDDLAAIRNGARRDGMFYEGAAVTTGFDSIRVAGEAASIVLVLDTGQTVVGDAVSVAYSGAGGRQTRFRHAEQLPLMKSFCETLEGQPIRGFLELSDWLEAQPFDNPTLHRAAVEYGVSQALLHAVAEVRRLTCAEVLADELGIQLATDPVPINVQCGDERQLGVDKAILRRADVLPQGLINSDDLVGPQGEQLQQYVSWIVGRVKKYGPAGYRPEFHIDTYGLLGKVFGHDSQRIARYIAGLAERAEPYAFCLETPVLMDSRAAQIEQFGAIRHELKKVGSTAQLVVDEWANHLEDIRAWIEADATDMINVKSPDLGSVGNAARAVLACWQAGVRPILGGSCTDTDQSARTISHVALATRPAWILARPGMGIDEGFQIVHNEMIRTLAIVRARKNLV